MSDLKAELTAILGDSFRGLIQDATSEDALRLAETIVNDLIAAQAEGREDLVEEMLGQVRLIGEAHRIRATNESWRAVAEVIRAVFRMLVLR